MLNSPGIRPLRELISYRHLHSDYVFWLLRYAKAIHRIQHFQIPKRKLKGKGMIELQLINDDFPSSTNYHLSLHFKPQGKTKQDIQTVGEFIDSKKYIENYDIFGLVPILG